MKHISGIPFNRTNSTWAEAQPARASPQRGSDERAREQSGPADQNESHRASTSKSTEGKLCRGDGHQRTVRDWASETNIVKVRTRPERIQRQSRRPRSLRGTTRASDSSASGCRASAREYSAFPESFARLHGQLMSARGRRADLRSGQRRERSRRRNES
jgi:hypothetical protein